MACQTNLVPSLPPFFPSGCQRVQLSPAARPFQPSPSVRVVLVRWTPPPRGWFKLNFDGSVYNDGSARASIGGVIRDSAGRVVVSFAEKTEHSTVGVVEARARARLGQGRGGGRRPSAGAAAAGRGDADADPGGDAGGDRLPPPRLPRARRPPRVPRGELRGAHALPPGVRVRGRVGWRPRAVGRVGEDRGRSAWSGAPARSPCIAAAGPRSAGRRRKGGAIRKTGRSNPTAAGNKCRAAAATTIRAERTTTENSEEAGDRSKNALCSSINERKTALVCVQRKKERLLCSFRLFLCMYKQRKTALFKY
jgi:hypothetical protein